MLIVEIVVSGLKGLPPSLRVTPQAGVNVFPAVAAERRRRFLDAIFHTLHADAAGPEQLAWLADTRQPSSRLAIAVRGRDGAIYRLVRDFGTGAACLLRKQGEGSDWSSLSNDVGEVAQFVRVQLRSPPFAAYERLYVLAPGQLVCRGEAAESRAGGSLWPAPAASGGGGMAGGGGGGLGGNLGYGSAITSASLRMPSALGMAPAPRSNSGVFAMDTGPIFTTQDVAPTSPLAAIPRAPTAVNPMNALHRSGIDAAQPAMDVESMRREHARLLSHVELLRGARGMRHELDRLLREREHLRAAVAEVQAAVDALEAARAEAETYRHLEGLPPGVGERIRDLDGAEVRRQKELARLDEERDEVERAQARARGKPLAHDPVFIAGAVVWMLTIVIAFAIESTAVALLNIVGAALAAVSALAHVSAMERVSRLDVRRASVEEKAARLDKQYELETGVARKLLASLDADPMDLLHQIEAASEVSAARAAAEHRVELLESDPQRRAEIARLTVVEARIDEVEGQLLSLEGNELGSSSAEDVERRLAALTRELTERGVIGTVVGKALPAAREDADGRGRRIQPLGPDDDERLVSGEHAGIAVYLPAYGDEAPLPGWAIGGPGGGGGGVGSYGGEGPDASDGTAALGAALADVVHRPIEILGPALMPRLTQYLRAFTRGALVGAEIGPDGTIRIRPAEADVSSPLSSVEPSLARAVEAAIHLAWLEAAVSRVAVPVLIDDPFVGVPAGVRKLIGKALGYIGERTQVIVLTPEDDLAGHVLGG